MSFVLGGCASAVATEDSSAISSAYILDTTNKVIHFPACLLVQLIEEEDQEEYWESIFDKIDEGYKKCGYCMG